MVAGHIERLARAGHAVAIITHDMDLALRLCARSIILPTDASLPTGRPSIISAMRISWRRAGLAAPAIAPALRWLARQSA